MSIRKRGDTWVIDYYSPTGERVRKTFKQKKDEVAEHAKQVALIKEKRYLNVEQACTTTLSALCDHYTKNFSTQISWHNKRGYVENIKQFFGGDTVLDQIRFVQVETYLNHLKAKPVSGGPRKAASINREMACLHHLFKKAVEWQFLERSPFDRGRSLIIKENNARTRFLNDREIDLLREACPSWLRPIVECAVLTGMRQGEILSLKWDQVRNGFIYLSKTKTNEARQIPVSDALEGIFREIRVKQGLGVEYVFEQRNIKRAFTAAVTRAGLVDFHFHDLRHTFASQVLLNGGTLKDVQELLGHKTMTMTLRYSHLTQEHKRVAVNLLNKLIVTNSHKKRHAVKSTS